jgi:hypothetical protein
MRLPPQAATFKRFGDRAFSATPTHACISLPPSVVINGCESMERLDQAFEGARTVKPMSEAEMAKLLAKTRQAAMIGKFEPFKTTSQFDGTAHHPEWLG